MKTRWKRIYDSRSMTEWRAVLTNGNRLRVMKFKGRNGGLTFVFHNKESGLNNHVSLSRTAAIAFATKTLSLFRMSNSSIEPKK